MAPSLQIHPLLIKPGFVWIVRGCRVISLENRKHNHIGYGKINNMQRQKSQFATPHGGVV